MFCSLCLKFSFLSCSCFLRCCFKKQKSQARSLLILLRLHSPQMDDAQRRLHIALSTNDDDWLLFAGWRVACRCCKFMRLRTIPGFSTLVQVYYLCLELNQGAFTLLDVYNLANQDWLPEYTFLKSFYLRLFLHALRYDILILKVKYELLLKEKDIWYDKAKEKISNTSSHSLFNRSYLS